MNHQAVVEQAHLFANANPQWATPEGALDQCLTASAAFIEHLLAAGLISRECGNGWY